MTPYYQDDLVTIYHGDCREWMDEVQFRLVGLFDVVVTDPPYGTGAYAMDTSVLDGPMLNSWPNAAVFGWPERLIRLCVEAGRVPDEWVTWWPTNAAIKALNFQGLARESECIAIFGTADWSQLTRPRSMAARRIAEVRYNPENPKKRGQMSDPLAEARDGDVWRDPAPGLAFQSHLRLHPNEKPVSLMVKLIRALSGTVLDPFAGSGSTLVAAKSLNRRAIGIEIEERYCEIAAQRCSQEVLGLAV